MSGLYHGDHCDQIDKFEGLTKIINIDDFDFNDFGEYLGFQVWNSGASGRPAGQDFEKRHLFVDFNDFS